MRNVYFSIMLAYIINTVDIKQIDSLGYWPIKDYLSKYTHHHSALKLLSYVFEGQPFLNWLHMTQ